MDALTSQFARTSLGTTSSQELAYLIGTNGRNASYFLPSSNELYVTQCMTCPDRLEVGNLYLRSLISSRASFSDLSERAEGYYTRRRDFDFTEDEYDYWILCPLLLGCRVRDFHQTCATVISRSPLILTMPSRPGYLKKAQFYTEVGEFLDVFVDDVIRTDGQKNMKLFCTPIGSLPWSVEKNARLEYQADNPRISIVTTALESFYNDDRSIDDFELLDLIYGEEGVVVHPRVDRTLITIRKWNPTIRKYMDIKLNAEQSEAVRHYQSPHDCPAFAVESPPGSGKTLTAAAMAASYDGDGLQLLLSTANVPVFNMALALDDLCTGEKKIVHLVSTEKEVGDLALPRSPFSIFDDEENPMADRMTELEEELKNANGREARRIKNQIRRAHAVALANSAEYDIILGTVDMILGKLLKKKNPKHPCSIQEQLESDVRRIIIDEASQMTEAALNVIILCFPEAQIVLIGDSKQLPPFKYEKGETVSELAARSALKVLKQKRNVPVITLRQVYRAAPSMIKHYSDCFYGGKLVSKKPESSRVQLTSICEGICKRSMFMEVKKSKCEQSGTSKINDGEIAALEYVIEKLRRSGYGHDSVMIVAYYEAQRKLAESCLPDGYETLTVDSAQGREKDIVVVLTTRDTKTEAEFFTCPLRCNVAVSRHKEAIIVLGHKAILKIEPWKEVLSDEYFEHITYG